ncbi:MAG: hypothetical protein QOJ00_2175 [Actinomycetota bacterium]|jgi:hypothetical protein
MTEQRASWITTAVFAATAIGGDVAYALRGVAAAVAGLMFVGGSILMCVALVIAAGRSRTKNIGIGGLFFLADAAPRDVQVQLLGSLALQVVIGIGTAAARPFTGAALGVLAPLAGLGFTGLWGARYGAFADRGVPR